MKLEKLSKVSTGQIDLLLTEFLRGKHSNTISAYKSDLVDFSRHLKCNRIVDALNLMLTGTPGDGNRVAIGYRSHLLEIKLSPSTINRRLSSLRSIIGLAKTFGIIHWSLDVKNLRAETYRDTRGPGKTKFELMLSAVAKTGNAKSLRDHAILRILYDLGLRVSELCNLDLADFDFERSSLAILGKGRKEKSLLFAPRVTCEAVSLWVEHRGSWPGPLFSNFDRAKKGNGRVSRIGVYQMVKKLGLSVSVSTSPHGLRHLSITEAVKLAQANGFGIEDVLDHSRHSSLKTLQIYVDRVTCTQGSIAELVANSCDGAGTKMRKS